MKTSTCISLIIRVGLSLLSAVITVVTSVFVAREPCVIGIALCVHAVIGIFAPLASALICLRNDEAERTDTWLIDIIAACGPATGIAIVGAVLWDASPLYARVGTIISAIVILGPISACAILLICIMGCNVINWCVETYYIVIDREVHAKKYECVEDTTLVV